MKTHTTLVLAITFLAAGVAAPASSAVAAIHVPTVIVEKGPGLASRIDSLVRDAARTEGFRGAVLVTQKGRAVLRKGYGTADAGRHTANGPQTQFRLAGFTPLAEAVTALQLEERGKLSLQDPMCRYLSPCPASWRSITVRELLNGTSGLAGPRPGTATSKIRTVGEYLAAAAKQPLRFKPGTRTSNGPAGYVALIPVIERASREPYTQYLQQHMFRPLAMTHTEVSASSTGATRNLAARSAGSSRASALNEPWTLALDGISSTVDDLYRWSGAVLGCGIVSPQSLVWALQPGWHLESTVQGHLIVQVTGSSGRASAGERVFPFDGVTIIVLATGGKSVHRLLEAIQTTVLQRLTAERPTPAMEVQ